MNSYKVIPIIILALLVFSFAEAGTRKSRHDYEREKRLKEARKKRKEQKRKANRTSKQIYEEEICHRGGPVFYIINNKLLGFGANVNDFIKKKGYFEISDCEVIQVINENTLLVSDEDYVDSFYALRINDTTGIVDGSSFSFTKKSSQFVKRIGTYSYISVIGAKKTVPLITVTSKKDQEVYPLTFEIYKQLTNHGIRIPSWKIFHKEYFRKGRRMIDVGKVLCKKNIK